MVGAMVVTAGSVRDKKLERLKKPEKLIEEYLHMHE